MASNETLIAKLEKGGGEGQKFLKRGKKKKSVSRALGKGKMGQRTRVVRTLTKSSFGKR